MAISRRTRCGGLVAGQPGGPVARAGQGRGTGGGIARGPEPLPGRGAGRVTLAGFFSAAYGGSTLTVPLTDVLIAWELPTAWPTRLMVVTAVISYFSLVLGELVPKRIALQRAEAVSSFVAPSWSASDGCFARCSGCCPGPTNALVRLLGMDPMGVGGEQITEEQLRDMVVSSQQFTVEARRVLGDVFGATDRQLSEVMVPRILVRQGGSAARSSIPRGSSEIVMLPSTPPA